MRLMNVLVLFLSIIGAGNPVLFSSQVEKSIGDATSQAETAVIEKVFTAEDDGYMYISYQITWHGHQVIIPEPINSTSFKVGDKLRFIVMKHTLSEKGNTSGKKVLAFISIPRSIQK